MTDQEPDESDLRSATSDLSRMNELLSKPDGKTEVLETKDRAYSGGTAALLRHAAPKLGEGVRSEEVAQAVSTLNKLDPSAKDRLYLLDLADRMETGPRGSNPDCERVRRIAGEDGA